jgi:hypothetical protein
VRLGARNDHLFNVGERGVAIDFRLPLPKKIEVRTIQDIYR